MKNFYNNIKTILIALFSIAFISTVSAQCPNDNYQYGTSNAPSTVGSLTTLSTCMYGGEYRLVNNMQAGSQYSFETCGDSDFDTQLTVRDNVTGSVVAYNDDFCGLQSKVTFTSNGNSVRVLIDRYYCSSQSSCMTLKATRVSGPSSINPCNSISALTCTNTGTFSLSGSGGWNSLGGPWSTPGAEKVFSFTPTLSGSHNIAISNSSYYVDLYVKSGSCGPTGWTYINDISSFGTQNNSVTLSAGVTYYFLIDDENTSASSGTISVTCPSPANNPCNSITALTCGVSSSYSLGSGNGAWMPGGPWGTPGNEQVFSYTPPTSGAYDIQVLNSGYYVDLFYKTGSCSSGGWTYVSDIYSNETNSVNLVGGVTYLFLIDDENTSASSGSINIECPCIPPAGGIDASLTVTSNTSYASTTIGACNDCSFRSSDDRVLEVNITCKGEYTFSTCGGASWDTYLYLSTAPCGGSIIALNDDNCGLRSSMSALLNPGTYYVAVEGFSSSSKGSFNLSIDKACNMLANASSPQFNCGNNISCNGLSDGSASVALTSECGSLSYIWSNGSVNPISTGLAAGTYSVTVSDGFGCTASSSTTLTEPAALVADAGSDEIVYYGYTPLSCANLNGSEIGGCPSYGSDWSANNSSISSSSSTTVCPSTTTTYTYTVTDQNGCTAFDEMTVCAVDVTCGNNGNKVEVCHVPPGNPNNPQSICVSASAVATHLAHGCSLGACGEVAATCGSSRLANNSNNNYVMTSKVTELQVMPNPFDSEFNVSLTLSTSGDYNLQIVDIFGRIIETSSINNFEANENKTINVNSNNMAKGIYLIRVINSEANIVGQSKRIIKQ